AQSELTERKRPFGAEPPRAEALQVFGQRVFRAVNDPQILPASTLHRRLNQAAPPSRNELERLHHHSLSAASGQILPPLDSLSLAGGVGDVHFLEGRGQQKSGVRPAQFRELFHVPQVILASVDFTLRSQKMKGSELQVIEGTNWPAVSPIRLDVL